VEKEVVIKKQFRDMAVGTVEIEQTFIPTEFKSNEMYRQI
jgi:hypothetical protein